MTLMFYMDVHVPAAITEGLRRRGIDVLTSQEDGTREADDEALLARAMELDRVLFTQDQDFLAAAHRCQQLGQHFAGIVFAHQLGATVGQCVEDLNLIAQCATNEEVADAVTFLPLA